jgi:hypothetical protein
MRLGSRYAPTGSVLKAFPQPAFGGAELSMGRDVCCVPRKPAASIRCHSAPVCLRIFCVSAACLIAAQRMALWVGLLVEKAALELWLA